MYVKTVLALQFVTYFSFFLGVFTFSEIPSLPFCPQTEGTGFVLVSTLDGKLSAVDSKGNLTWEIETGPGPLLVSNIHNLELTNNGEWVRIIPSLTGTLYKFDGSTIDPISITADTLLKSSFKYSDDLVIAGAIEVRTYGVGFRSGDVLYECTPKNCLSKDQQNTDDVLLIERSTQTVRAVEPRSGIERWNFSVGLHSIKLPHISCIDQTTKVFDWNLTTILPEGILKASTTKNNVETTWQYQFSAPIVRVWRWNGLKLTEINLFSPKNIPNVLTTPFLPSIYVGMHQKQLYIHESVTMQNVLHGLSHTDLVVAESTSVAKIPWKPIPASTQTTEDDATALSVLNGSEYVNGNGYYLYSEADIDKKNNQLCENNKTDSIPLEEEIMEEINNLHFMNVFFFKYMKELSLVLFTIVLCNILFRYWHNVAHDKERNNKEIIIIEKPIEAQVTRTMERTPSENSDSFTSRYLEDFDTIRCLGKGGFGVVFEVKQKIDECYYAIKRITLPKELKSRERVMREVKALAKLDHQNIVRYFCSWVERPPLGWKEEHDKQWIEEKSELKTRTTATSTHSKFKRSKSASVSIDIPLHRFQETLDFNDDDDLLNDDDSFIVFEKTTDEKSASANNADHILRSKSDSHVVFECSTSGKLGNDLTVQENIGKTCSTVSSGIDLSQNTFSEHLRKKIDWKRPGRKHHSWDISQGILLPIAQEIEPPVYLYIQMQLCQKESLKEWLNNNKNREYDFVLDIFSQILDAVEYVHLRGLIHRDLKPSNIFFSLEGQIKIGDFGLVKDMEDSLDLELSRSSFGYSNKSGHTREVGTHLYMSPEQFHSRLYNYKVDIYSLGLIFFELLVPFSTDMERIKTLTDVKKHVYPDNFQKQYTNEYNLLQNMLCENPEKRLTTVGIRAKPPFNKTDPLYGEDCYYSLKNLQKS